MSAFERVRARSERVTCVGLEARFVGRRAVVGGGYLAVAIEATAVSSLAVAVLTWRERVQAVVGDGYLAVAIEATAVSSLMVAVLGECAG